MVSYASAAHRGILLPLDDFDVCFRFAPRKIGGTSSRFQHKTGIFMSRINSLIVWIRDLRHLYGRFKGTHHVSLCPELAGLTIGMIMQRS